MSFLKIWVHYVFSTKGRQPFLSKEVRKKVFNHIQENCRQKEIYLIAINGYDDHIHCLISLGKEQSIANVAKMIKGESSRWINNEKILSNYFSWQDDYFAVSVSESQMEVVKRYIYNQESHHTKKTFDEEVALFFKLYKWEKTLAKVE